MKGKKRMARQSFDEWATLVSQWVSAFTQGGLTDTDALPNVDYYTWWREGMSPKTAARLALKNASDS